MRPTRPFLHAIALGLLFWLCVATGCVAEPPGCYPGDHLGCSCSETQGKTGYRACSDGQYGACVCDGSTPGLAGIGGAGGQTPGTGGEGGTDKQPFLAPCDHDEECITGLCHAFNAKGPRCSKPCETSSDCPPPSPGCNNKGVCKAP